MKLFDTTGTLPNGDVISDRDVVMTWYGPYVTIERVVDIDGKLSLQKNFMYGTVPIYHYISQGGEVKKVTPKEVYLFCKANGWDTKKYLALFK